MEVAWELDYGATSNGWEDEVETRELILLNMIRLRTVDRSCALTTQAGSDWGHGARSGIGPRIVHRGHSHSVPALYCDVLMYWTANTSALPIHHLIHQYIKKLMYY